MFSDLLKSHNWSIPTPYRRYTTVQHGGASERGCFLDRFLAALQRQVLKIYADQVPGGHGGCGMPLGGQESYRSVGVTAE